MPRTVITTAQYDLCACADPGGPADWPALRSDPPHYARKHVLQVSPNPSQTGGARTRPPRSRGRRDRRDIALPGRSVRGGLEGPRPSRQPPKGSSAQGNEVKHLPELRIPTHRNTVIKTSPPSPASPDAAVVREGGRDGEDWCGHYVTTTICSHRRGEPRVLMGPSPLATQGAAAHHACAKRARCPGEDVSTE